MPEYTDTLSGSTPRDSITGHGQSTAILAVDYSGRLTRCDERENVGVEPNPDGLRITQDQDGGGPAWHAGSSAQ